MPFTKATYFFYGSVEFCVALVDLDPNLSLYLMILAVLQNQFTLLTDLLVIEFEGLIFWVSIDSEETPTKSMGSLKTSLATFQSSLKLLDRFE